jgi:lysophospholipase L1-like esterase
MAVACGALAPASVSAAAEPRPWPPAPQPGELAYVALGDSFAAGEGAPDPAYSEVDEGRWQAGTNVEHKATKNLCHRSVYAYAVDVARAAQLPLSFHACSGGNSADFTQPNSLFPGEPVPQLDWLTATTALVTVTLGGNDIKFAALAKNCITHSCEKALAKANDKLLIEDATLTGIYRQIRQRAPQARVLVTGYPRIFPSNPPAGGCRIPGVPKKTLNYTEMEAVNQLISRLNRVISRAVLAADPTPLDATPGSVEMVDIYNAFDHHELCTKHRFVNGIVGIPEVSQRQSIHPNRDGQRAIADAVKVCYFDRARCAPAPAHSEEVDLERKFEFYLPGNRVQCTAFTNGGNDPGASLCGNLRGHDLVELYQLGERPYRGKWDPKESSWPDPPPGNRVSVGWRRMFLFARDTYQCEASRMANQYGELAPSVRCESLLSGRWFAINEDKVRSG